MALRPNDDLPCPLSCILENLSPANFLSVAISESIVWNALATIQQCER